MKLSSINHKATSEFALEYMISSAFNTTMGSFSCHSLFFLVAEQWTSFTILTVHQNKYNLQEHLQNTHTQHIEMEKVPENLLNERTPNGVVPITVPSSSHTLKGSWAWSWHPNKREKGGFLVMVRKHNYKKRASLCCLTCSVFGKDKQENGCIQMGERKDTVFKQ